MANRSVGVSGQPGDLGAGSCASGDNQNQSGFQFPKEDEDLSGSMHWRPYPGFVSDKTNPAIRVGVRRVWRCPRVE